MTRAVTVFLIALLAFTMAPVFADEVTFSKHIAPILVDNCISCHNTRTAKGDYDVSSYELTADAVEEGDPEDSPLYYLLSHRNPKRRMPKDKDPLSPAEIDLIKRWIAEGGKYDGDDPTAYLRTIIPRPTQPTPPEVYTLPVPVAAVMFSPKGDHVVAGGYHEVTVWSTQDGSLVRRIPGVGQRVHGLTFRTASPTAKPGATVAVVPLGHPWRYQKGDKAAPEKWTEVAFDASKWPQGNSGFGYSNDEKELATVKTKLDDMKKEYLSVFIRTEFSLADPASLYKLLLTVLIDDGFVAYLNGEEIGRYNVEGSPPAHDTTASDSEKTESVEVVVDITGHIGKLKKGKNVLAIQGHNRLESTDFVLSPTLNAVLKSVETAPDLTAPPGFTKGGQLLAVASGTPGRDGSVHLIDYEKGVILREIAVAPEIAFGLAFRPDGKKLATAGGDGSVRIFDVATWKEEMTIKQHDDWALAVAWNADGSRLVSASRDKTAKIYDVTTGDVEATYVGHEDPVYRVAFTADGKHVWSAGADKNIRKWNSAPSLEREMSEKGKDPKTVATVGGARLPVYAMDLQAGMVFSGSSDRSVRLHQASDQKHVRTYSGHTDSVYSVNYHEGTKRLVTGSYNGEVRIFDSESGALILSFVAAPGSNPLTTGRKLAF